MANRSMVVSWEFCEKIGKIQNFPSSNHRKKYCR